MQPVTDPAILAQLEGGMVPVTDKSVLAQLDGSMPKLSVSLLTPDSEGLKNVGMGALRGASDIGATLLSPVDWLKDKITGKPGSNAERRASLKDFFAQNANPESGWFKGGELVADIAGTAGAGGMLAKAPGIAQYAPKLAAALESGGLKLGGTPATTVAGKAANAVARIGAGATVGGVSAGLVDPSSAGTGAVIGGALPVAVKAAGTVGKALSPEVSPEVSALYQKAQKLGIEIPADRLTNSRPLNAVASSLNYVPLSGRAGTEEKMISQLNRAVSRTFGQDSDNITGALRKADFDLGMKFERTLSGNKVSIDQPFLDDLVKHLQTAQNELGDEGAKIIGKQIDTILAKANAAGELEGQAAYNIKKTLDRIGNRNSNEAFYARELKKSLMDALNRSLGPQEASAFAKVRQQYGAMLDMQNLAQNGAEGGVSIGRLANLKNINNPELQDIADIAAQFVKTRESPHGAAQRIVLGGLGLTAAGATGTLPLLAGGVAAGRGVNALLNSQTAKNVVLGKAHANKLAELMASPELRSLGYVSGANP